MYSILKQNESCVGEIFKGYRGSYVDLYDCINNGGIMRHCCSFDAEEVFYLQDNALYSERALSIGFCPICSKFVAELIEKRFDEVLIKTKKSGTKAENFVNEIKKEMSYKKSDINYLKFKPKPFGWKYGENKIYQNNGKTYLKQFAKDFYGNKSLVKITPE